MMTVFATVICAVVSAALGALSVILVSESMGVGPKEIGKDVCKTRRIATRVTIISVALGIASGAIIGYFFDAQVVPSIVAVVASCLTSRALVRQIARDNNPTFELSDGSVSAGEVLSRAAALFSPSPIATTTSEGGLSAPAVSDELAATREQLAKLVVELNTPESVRRQRIELGTRLQQETGALDAAAGELKAQQLQTADLAGHCDALKGFDDVPASVREQLDATVAARRTALGEKQQSVSGLSGTVEQTRQELEEALKPVTAPTTVSPEDALRAASEALRTAREAIAN